MWRYYFIFLQIEYKTIAKNSICFKRNRRKIPLLLLSAKVRGLKQSWRCLYIQINKTKRNKEKSLLNEKIAIMSIFVSLWSYWVPTMSQGPCQQLYMYYLKSSLQTGEMEIVILTLLMKLSLWKLKYLGENSRGWQS